MAGLSLVTLLVVAAVTWTIVAPDGGVEAPGSDGDRYVVDLPTTSGDEVPAGSASATLQALARALGDGDSDAVVAAADPADPAAVDRLTQLARNAVAVRLRGVSMRYIDADGPVADDGTWTAAVDVSWRYAGFDRRDATTEVRVAFRTDGTSVWVTDLGGGEVADGLRTPVWLSGPLTVQRDPDLLVVAAGPDARVEPYVERGTTAVAEVAEVLGARGTRLVVEVPADQAALERALGVEPGGYEQIAAVAGTADGSTTPSSPVHVFVNPDVFDGLGRDGQQVVLTHEATHVVTDAPFSRAPTWLVEGFADYVALRDTDLPLTTTAAQIAERVRAGELPTELPTADEFNTRGPHLGAVYESAWLLCVTLADRGGQEALVRFYDAVSDGGAVPDELGRGFRWDQRELVGAWRTTLLGLPAA